jgi:ethanolamine ammonia-lyase small subunit
MDHAQARDAVYSDFDVSSIEANLKKLNLPVQFLQSKAVDRREYLLRPDYGRVLADVSRAKLEELQYPENELSIVIADGLSARAVNTHAIEVIKLLVPELHKLDWRLAPISVVEQGRVAIADEIGQNLTSQMVIIFIGERPGLSSPHSMGAYLTYRPRVGLTDESRNCISNIRPDGIGYSLAAEKLLYLLTEMKQHQLSGVGLKDDFGGYLT